jgi:hypothetical protein
MSNKKQKKKKKKGISKPFCKSAKDWLGGLQRHSVLCDQYCVSLHSFWKASSGCEYYNVMCLLVTAVRSELCENPELEPIGPSVSTSVLLLLHVSLQLIIFSYFK